MTRQDAATKISTVLGCPQRVAKRFLDVLLDAMSAEMAKGTQIKFRDFGTFTVVRRAARIGRNLSDPAQRVTIPARRAVKFVASPKLSDALQKGKA